MDWVTIGTIILGSSVLGSVLNNVVSWYLQTRERGRHNSFLALTLAHEFEKYAYSCINILNDDELYKNFEGHAGTFIGYPPRPCDLPESNYRDFDIELLDSILEFPQKASFAKKEVVLLSDILEEDKAHDVSRKNTVELANHALSIAGRLRGTYDLPIRELKFGSFNLRKELEKMML